MSGHSSLDVNGREVNLSIGDPSSSSSLASASISTSISSSLPHSSASRNSIKYPIASTESGDQNVNLPFSRFHLHIPPHLHSMTAGAGAGLVSSIVTCPLDVVKTRLQAQSAPKSSKEYESLQQIILRIYKTSGLKGFYRGLGPTLGGYLPTWGIYFTVYDAVKDKFEHRDTPNKHSAATHIVAAVSAGATGTIFTNPLWVVRTRFMAQAGQPPSEQRYKSTIGAITTIIRTEGPRALYKGLLPSLMGVSHVAVQFPLYEQAKTWADGREGDHSNLSPTTILACSAFSKMIASLATYPHEVLRTRLQIVRNSPTPSPAPSSSFATPDTRYINSTPNTSASASAKGTKERIKGGVIDTFKSIRKQDGYSGFYRGLSINLVRTVPNSAVTMLTYELIMRNLANLSTTTSSSASD